MPSIAKLLQAYALIVSARSDKVCQLPILFMLMSAGGVIRTVALLALVLVALQTRDAVAGGCDISVTPGAINHMLVVGACTTDSDAHQACVSFAQDHGYDATACGIGGYSNGGINWSLWGAGYLCETKPPPGSYNCGPWGTLAYAGNFYFLQYFSKTLPAQESSCGPTCDDVGDPINPASGAVFSTEGDLDASKSTLPFRRFYNSHDATSSSLSLGWRHSFSASIRPRTSGITQQKYLKNDPAYTALYSSPSNACVNGFNTLKTRVPNWQSASANFSNGRCNLTVNGVSVGTLPIFAAAPELAYMPPLVNSIAGPTVLGFDAVRDDGQTITFWLEGGILVPPHGVPVRLQQTASGFTLIDAADNVETYDANGRLTGITARSGVVQTMAYDASGRLSTVTDNLGHALIFNYDGQSRLSSVTRE